MVTLTDEEYEELRRRSARLEAWDDRRREMAAIADAECARIDRVLRESDRRAQERRAILRRAGVIVDCPRCGHL